MSGPLQAAGKARDYYPYMHRRVITENNVKMLADLRRTFDSAAIANFSATENKCLSVCGVETVRWRLPLFFDIVVRHSVFIAPHSRHRRSRLTK